MRNRGTYRQPVRLEFHLSAGYTRVILERVAGKPMDIATADIPLHLRQIGARFIVVFDAITPEEGDTFDEIREAISVRVEELMNE